MDQVAEVYLNDQFVGWLSKVPGGYEFQYHEEFLSSSKSSPISWNFPLKREKFKSEKLFPFFEGLVSEGWLLKVQSQTLKIDERDYFSMLLENGWDLIGGIKVKRVK